MTFADERDDLARICDAAIAEAERTDVDAVLTCAGWPTGALLLTHLGGHFGWVLAAFGATERPRRPRPPDGVDLATWFAQECRRFVRAMTDAASSDPAWTFEGSGSAGFWKRRSLYEIGRHVWDLRTAGGARPAPPPEFSPARYADGVQEHFDVFLTMTRDTLEPLPGTLRFVATDAGASWTLAPDWELSSGTDSGTGSGTADATVSAAAGELALLLWERADALTEPQFLVEGDERVVAAFQSAPIHV